MRKLNKDAKIARNEAKAVALKEAQDKTDTEVSLRHVEWLKSLIKPVTPKVFTVYWAHYANMDDVSTQGYVGCTGNYSERQNAHFQPKSQSKLKHLDKDAVRFTVLATFDNSDDAFALEKSFRPTANIGWNTVMGGGTGGTHLKGRKSNASKLTDEQRSQLEELSLQYKYKVVNPTTPMFAAQARILGVGVSAVESRMKRHGAKPNKKWSAVQNSLYIEWAENPRNNPENTLTAKEICEMTGLTMNTVTHYFK
jgi:predicted GIY-YIG superfamily endonuclease